MKIDMKILRWVLPGLYVVLVVGLLGMAYSGRLPGWIPPLEALEGKLFWTFIVLAITVVSQAVFILVPGTIDLCRPVRRRRLAAPVLIAALMMALLVAALTLCIVELAELSEPDWFAYVFWAIIGSSWITWSIVFFKKYRDTVRYKALKNLVSTVIAGSLLELLVAIPSHIIVSRRPGCLVGLGTACGIGTGIVVMLWAFGPGVILLFLREKYKAELER